MIDPLRMTSIPEKDEALRAEVRAFLEEELAGVPADVRARSWMGFDAGFSRKLAARGWIGITFPRAYGGGERSLFARFVLSEELLAAGAPVSAHWIADRQSGPLILKYGTEEQKRFYVPRICAGEAFFCIGMSEPDVGSDLAGVKTRAVRTGDGWRLKGRKIWTTNAFRSDYMIALVRTSGSPEDRHRGLSQVIVDLRSPGVTVRPIRDLVGDEHFCEVEFDDVELPDGALIGEESRGWEQVISELAFERSGPERLLSSIVLLDQLVAWLRSRPAPPPAAQAFVGRCMAHLSVLRAMSLAVCGKLDAGESPVLESALVKDLGTELEQQVPVVVADICAHDPSVRVPAELLRTLSYLSAAAPSFSLRGGTREILRGMIAKGFGLR